MRQSDVRAKRIGINIAIVGISLMLVFSAAGCIEDTTKNDDNGKRDEDIDFTRLYDSPSLGRNMAMGYDRPINDEYSIKDSVNLTDLPIYTYYTVNWSDFDEIDEYIEAYGFDADAMVFSIDHTNKWQTYRYDNDTVHIGIIPNGQICIEHNLSSSKIAKINITQEKAISMTETYLKEHFSVDLDEAVRDISSSKVPTTDGTGPIDFFYINYYPKLEGRVVHSGAHEDHVFVVVDALKGQIDMVTYHWPDYVKLGDFDEDDFNSLKTTVDSFISNHNKVFNGSYSKCNITSVSVIYSNTIGYTMKDATNGSPYFLYIPYVYVEWETGVTYLSPLKGD